MKALSEGLAAHLDSATTTLATCWRLARRDGTVLGFTDHDRPLTFDGTTFEAASGLSSSEDVAMAGLGIGGREVSGALTSAAVSEDDIAGGLYDGASIEIFQVDWRDPTDRVRVRVGTLGEVIEEDGAFRAEVRSLAAALDQPRGRLYQHRCDADLGDARCGVNLAAGSFRGSGTVIASSDRRRISASGLGAFAAGLFDRGKLSFTGGANAGQAIEVKLHAVNAGTVTLDLWRPVAQDIQPGDTFQVTAGCDKLYATCRERFANGNRFRGFPHIPGNDFVLANPSRARQERDGGAQVR